MMGRRAVSKDEVKPFNWIFAWREPRRSIFPKLLATMIVAIVFGMLLSLVRVPVVRPVEWSGQKASMMYLPPNAEGKAWALRAKESGPFPSRFELKGWEGLAKLEAEALEAARMPLPTYVPKLRDLPLREARQPATARGGAVFPKRAKPAPEPPRSVVELTSAPTLQPISGITHDEMPEELPPFAEAVQGSPAAVPGELFLLRLNPEGAVAESVSLSGNGFAALEKWLTGVAFPLKGEPAERWVSVAVTFTNQPAAHGSGSR